MPQLKYLESTNQGGQRQVCVTFVSDASPVQGRLEFRVCAETLNQNVDVPASSEKKICQKHNSSGTCWVVVSLVGMDVSTKKWLDLDKELDS